MLVVLGILVIVAVGVVIVALTVVAVAAAVVIDIVVGASSSSSSLLTAIVVDGLVECFCSLTFLASVLTAPASDPQQSRGPQFRRLHQDPSFSESRPRPAFFVFSLLYSSFRVLLESSSSGLLPKLSDPLPSPLRF